MNNPQRYRHRTAEIEAVQWTGSNADALRAFAGSDFDEIDLDDRTEDPDETAAVREAEHGTWRGLKPGDWVVRLEEGLYEFSADDFAKAYEPVPAGLVAVPPTTADRDRIAPVVGLFATLVRQRADHIEASHARLRDKLEVTQARIRRLHAADRNGECQHCHHSSPCPTVQVLDNEADAVLGVLPAGSGDTAALTDAERTMLTYALDQAQEKIWSEDGFTDEDQAAVTSLRRLADEAQQQPETETPVHIGGQANAEDCPACCATPTPPPYPWTCPGPAVSVVGQTGEEADNPRTVCVCGHTRGEHLRVSGRLLCDACDPDSTDNLVCKEFEAL